MSTVTDSDAIVAVVRNLVGLQARLARLEQERAAIQAEIARSMGELARLSGDVALPVGADAPVPAFEAAQTSSESAPPPPPVRYPSAAAGTLAGALLAHLAHDPGRGFNVEELMRAMNVRGDRAKTNVRATLSRLCRRGRIARANYGKYMAKAI
jgi:hypothetical protein